MYLVLKLVEQKHRINFIFGNIIYQTSSSGYDFDNMSIDKHHKKSIFMKIGDDYSKIV